MTYISYCDIISLLSKQHRGIAQLVEQRSPKPRVLSSSLSAPETKKHPIGCCFVSGGFTKRLESPTIARRDGENSPIGNCFRGRVLAFAYGESFSAPDKKKDDCESNRLFSVKSADGGINPPAVDEIASR